MNDTLYVPEHFATLRPEPVPADDLAVLSAVVAAARAAGPARAPATGTTCRWWRPTEIARHVPPDPLEAQGYRAALRVVERDRRTEPGNDTFLAVEITNTGAGAAPARGRPPACRSGWAPDSSTPEPARPATDWALTPLPCDIPPGESRIAGGARPRPGRPGMHTVEVDLVNERARWFGCPRRADLVVASRWGRFAL